MNVLNFVLNIYCPCTSNFQIPNLGVAQLMNKRNGHRFSENDDGLLQVGKFELHYGTIPYVPDGSQKFFRLLRKSEALF